MFSPQEASLALARTQSRPYGCLIIAKSRLPFHIVCQIENKAFGS